MGSEPDLFFPASDSSEDEAGPSQLKPLASPPAKARASSPRAKRAPSPDVTVVAHGDSAMPADRGNVAGYLGEFVCEGWSLSKGRGYCQPGSTVVFERPKPIKPAEARERTGPTKLENGKVVSKQLTLGAMMKKAAPPAVKKSAKQGDQIVRFRNDRGFEIGRLSVTEAAFLVHPLDTGMIRLTGHVIDCPQSLSTGCTILLGIKVHLTSRAFEHVSIAARTDHGAFWEDKQETAEEEAMRKRKESLAGLFNRIGMRPLRTNALSKIRKPLPKHVAPSVPGSPPEGDDSGDEAEKLDDEQIGQLDSIYRQAQMGDAQLDESEPPSTFLYTLRPYQKQALTWMHARELGDQSVRAQSALHPLWEEYAFKIERGRDAPIEVEDEEDISPERKFYWNPYSGELSLELPRTQVSSRGGILADAMGMGKTCMMASLIHRNRDADVETVAPEPAAKRRKFTQVTLSDQWRASTLEGAAFVPRATLVVCPVSLAAQWVDELGKMSAPGTIQAAVWHGADRADLNLVMGQEGKKRVDVLVTSYGTLVSEHGRWLKAKDKASYEGGSVFDYDFLRVVLDEAHNIKSRNAQVSKACYDLKAQRRWALTGTPIVNRLDDLFSLLHFLRLEPWGQHSFVTIPFLNQDPMALDVVQFILQSCLLRREKDMRDKDGRLIVDLPPKEVLEFSRPERTIYKQLEDRARRTFIELDADNRVMSNYTSILAMLMKLRQCVDHPLLVLGKGSDNDRVADKLLDGGATSVRDLIAQYAGGDAGSHSAYAAEVLKDLAETETAPECLICTSEIFDEVLLPCFHRGCYDCVVDWIGHCEDAGKPAKCPACDKGPLAVSDLRSIKRPRKRANPILGTTGGETDITVNRVALVASTKLRALVRKLQAMREVDPTFKALVFSQFTSFLDLIESSLSEDGINWLRFDGSMSQGQRVAVVDAFGRKTTEPLVLLISLKAGGVGLNLTMANHVFMMDTWWNEAIEQQAIDRVHRLGQTKPVYVTRYIIRGTVEKRIMKIQRTKTALVNASLAGDKGRDKHASLADMKKIFGLDEADSEDEAY